MRPFVQRMRHVLFRRVTLKTLTASSFCTYVTEATLDILVSGNCLSGQPSPITRAKGTESR